MKNQLTTFTSGASNWLEQWLGSIEQSELSKKLYPHFKVRVACIKRRPARHDAFEMLLYMGLNHIDPIMKQKPFMGRTKGELTFIFPERWLGVAEQGSFMGRLNKHPDAVKGKITQVNIITSCPLILTNIDAPSIRVITFSDDNEYDGDTGKKSQCLS